MSVGYSKEFNDATRPGFSPEAAEAAMRRLRDSELIQEQQAFQRQVSGAAADAGEIASAAGAARRITEEADRAEKERKERTDREILLDLIDNRIGQLDDMIEWYDRQIAEADAALDAIDEIEELIENGQLDPNNPAHAELLRLAGIDPDELEDDPAGVLSRAREAWRDRRDHIAGLRGDADREREGLRQRRAEVDAADTVEERAAWQREALELNEQDQLLDGNAISMRLVQQHGDTESFRAFLAETGRDEIEQADITAAMDEQDLYSAEYEAEPDGDAASYLSFADEIDPEGAALNEQQNTEAEEPSTPERDTFQIDIDRSGPAP